MSNKTNALFPLYKEKYEYETQRRRYYDNVINLPVTLVAFLIAGIYIVIIDSKVPQWFILPKTVLIILILACTVLSCWFLFQLYFKGRKMYASFPDSATVKARYDTIERLLAADPDKNKKIKEQFNADIESWYIDCNTKNTKTNDGRGSLFAYLNTLISAGYFFGLVLFILFWIAKSDIDNQGKMKEGGEIPQAKTVNIETTILRQESSTPPATKVAKFRKKKKCPSNQNIKTKEENIRKNDQEEKKDLRGDSSSKN